MYCTHSKIIDRMNKTIMMVVIVVIIIVIITKTIKAVTTVIALIVTTISIIIRKIWIMMAKVFRPSKMVYMVILQITSINSTSLPLLKSYPSCFPNGYRSPYRHRAITSIIILLTKMIEIAIHKTLHQRKMA